jgi:UDP-glucose 4-epimerase
VFGPRQNPHGEAGIVAIFSELMRAGNRPTIFGDGTKARDYVYVGDVAAANLAALRHGKNTTVNIGAGTIVTDKQMFEAIAGAMDFMGKPIYAPYRAGEIYRISLDARRARKILGWKPKMEFGKGIREAIS